MSAQVIQSVMTSAPHTIGAEQSLEVAHAMMSKHGIRHLPVLHGGRCVGILSDRDIRAALAAEGKQASEMNVHDFCTEDVYAVSPTTSVKEVAAFMGDKGVGSAVVVDDEKVVGIFTATDACKLLARVI